MIVEWCIQGWYTQPEWILNHLNPTVFNYDITIINIEKEGNEKIADVELDGDLSYACAMACDEIDEIPFI